VRANKLNGWDFPFDRPFDLVRLALGVSERDVLRQLQVHETASCVPSLNTSTLCASRTRGTLYAAASTRSWSVVTVRARLDVDDNVALREDTLYGLFDRVRCRVSLADSSRRRNTNDDVSERAPA
jgi:hypothetical protein